MTPAFVRERKLEKMEEFERDSLNIGVLTMTEIARDPEDESKWLDQRVDRFYRLWQAGARWGQTQQ